LTLAAAPTSSLAGGLQVVSRVIETGLHKMDVLGFDLTRVTSAIATAPLPPTARSDVRAIGRTNDCVLYGGQARYTVRAEDEELAALAERLPASGSHDYGTPFYDIFKRYDNDFYKIDPMLFSPAEVWLTSAITGRTFHGGGVNVDVLRSSLIG
jgi:methenyltetrahydromethanopterin cyclohydrolase